MRPCRTRLYAFAVFGTVSVFLAACATLPDQSNPSAPLASRPLVLNFTAAGRVAARVTGDTKRGFSGGFAWTHKPGGDIVELLTPLGQIAARVSMTTAGAEIELPDGRRMATSDPDRFLADTLGVALPVAALSYWLQAVPVALTPFRAEADAMGRLATLWQNGWQIQFNAYADETRNANPTRIQLSQGDIEVRMIISVWSPR